MYRPGFWGPSHAGGAGPTPLSNGIVAEPDAQRADFLLRSAPQGREQVAELFLDGRVVRVLKRGGDLLAQHVAVAPAESLHGGLHAPLGRAEPGRQRRIGDRAVPGAEDDLEGLELGGAAGVGVLARQVLQDAVEQPQGPGPVEEPVRRQARVGRLAKVAARRVAGVDRERRRPAAALPGPAALGPVAQEEAAVGAAPFPARVLRPSGRVNSRPEV